VKLRYLQTIFCDDIRHEIGGKFSYIGVYSTKLFIPSFPVAIPKLCIAMNAVTSIDHPFKQFSIRVLKEKDTLIEQKFTDEQLMQSLDTVSGAQKPKVGDLIQVLRISFIFSPFIIQSPCTLRVRAQTDSGELRGMGLAIEQTPIKDRQSTTNN
jgi:Family of unknown function (DUF6941)